MAEPAKRIKATSPATSLAAAITAAPKLVGPKDARARLDEWLGGIARSRAGKALKPLLSPDTKSRAHKLPGLVSAIAEASPYLWDLIRADADRFLALLEADPEARFAALIAAVTHAGLTETDEAEMMRVLR